MGPLVGSKVPNPLPPCRKRRGGPEPPENTSTGVPETCTVDLLPSAASVMHNTSLSVIGALPANGANWGDELPRAPWIKLKGMPILVHATGLVKLMQA